jgi:hypothetical protein
MHHHGKKIFPPAYRFTPTMLDQSKASKWLHMDLCFYLSHQQFYSFLSQRVSGCSICFLSETSCRTSHCVLHLHRCLLHLRRHHLQLRWHNCLTSDFDDTAMTWGGRSRHCSATAHLHFFEGIVSSFLDAASSFPDTGHYILDDALTCSSCDILTQGLIGLIESSYHQGIPSFLEAHLQRTLRLSVLGLEQF